MRDVAILLVGALLVATLYVSFVYLPRRAAVKKQIRYLNKLHVGDEVVTFGGIVGVVVDLDKSGGTARVEIADGVVVQVLTDALMQRVESVAVVRNTDEVRTKENA